MSNRRAGTEFCASSTKSSIKQHLDVAAGGGSESNSGSSLDSFGQHHSSSPSSPSSSHLQQHSSSNNNNTTTNTGSVSSSSGSGGHLTVGSHTSIGLNLYLHESCHPTPTFDNFRHPNMLDSNGNHHISSTSTTHNNNGDDDLSPLKKRLSEMTSLTHSFGGLVGKMFKRKKDDEKHDEKSLLNTSLLSIPTEESSSDNIKSPHSRQPGKRKRTYNLKTLEDLNEHKIFRPSAVSKFVTSHIHLGHPLTEEHVHSIGKNKFLKLANSTRLLRSNSNATENDLIPNQDDMEKSFHKFHVSEAEEEEDEATKLERKKNMPKFADATEELNYYIKHNMVDEFKLLLEKEKDEKEKSNKIFNVSSQYLDKESNQSTLLHKAATLNRFKIMTILVDEYKALIEKKDTGGSTPLFYAVANNCIRACVFLLTKGAKTDVKDNFDNTPLYVALRKGYLDIARTLILFNADVNFKSQKGQTCLHLCCEEGDLNKVEFLLDKGASVMRLNREEQHCLFQAAPYPQLVEYLCRYLSSAEEDNFFGMSQQDLDSPSPNGPRPSISKNIEIEEQNKQDMEFVGQIGSSTSTREFSKPSLSKLVNRMSGTGNTIIHHCAQNGYLNSLKIIVNYVSNEIIVQCLNEKDKKNGDSPLHLAVRRGHKDVVLLLARAREVDVDAQNDSAGDTALHIAISLQNQEIVTILVAANCSYNIKNNQKVTAKQLAKKMNINLKVEEDKTLKSLKTQNQTPVINFFQKMKFKFKKEPSQAELEKSKRHTSAFPSTTTKPTNNPNRPSTKTKSKRYSRSSSNMNKMISQEEIEELIKTQPYLKWNPKMEFDPDMNDIHKELFYLVNKLYFYWTADQHSIQIQICLSDLIERTRKFFAKQEQLMQDKKYPLLSNHKQEHDFFMNKIEGLLKKVNTEDFSIDEDQFAVIATWWVNHVVKHDMPLSKLTKK